MKKNIFNVIAYLIGFSIGSKIIGDVLFEYRIKRKKYFSAFFYHPLRFILWCLS